MRHYRYSRRGYSERAKLCDGEEDISNYLESWYESTHQCPQCAFLEKTNKIIFNPERWRNDNYISGISYFGMLGVNVGKLFSKIEAARADNQ